MSYVPPLTLARTARVINPVSARPDRRMISVKISYGRCSACNTMYSSERLKIGQRHKGCTASPAGRFKKT